MGKYMKKGKLAVEVAVMMDVSPLGVRMTRARTLALQRLKTQPQPTSSEQPSSSYLELRSRRLQKPLPAAKPKDTNHGPSPRANLNSSVKSKAASPRSCASKKAAVAEEPAAAAAEKDEGAEASFGENVVDLGARNRSARETTPSSLIRDSETIRTPGSTTRPSKTSTTNRKAQNSAHRNIPTAQEMEEFFAGEEQDQQKMFAEKYNFDPVNDHPLPGRYEWVRLDP